MPLVRKRRAAEPANSDNAAPESSTNRRQRPRGEDSSEGEMTDSDGGAGAPSSLDAMVKKMVRFALASEYSRLPIRRSDISAKVLGEQGTRQFKTVFEQAQRELKSKFGMEMCELPAREKTTISQRRAAQKIEKQSSSNKSWILITTLPRAYQTPAILPPAKAPSSGVESTYTALYTFIIALIILNGGALAEPKLDRYLTRMNADQHTPIDRTDKLLQRLCKEGYLVRTREMDGGEELIEYIVGPRGKIEVGSRGVAGLVREVFGWGESRSGDYGDGAAGLTQVEQEEKDIFEDQLKRSLGIRDRDGRVSGEAVSAQREEEASEGPRRSGRPSTAARREDSSSSSSSEEEEEEGEEGEDESD
ncbi:hypothetical protein N7532_010123 [Penicillium argentinense]|uniref:MAGE domain-containing protein n=1 Tax=Penicillium argentinense TaxID=1131581 RepID=A0A9W9JY71_9EURO|nr:uncharacterized protein N7532_010123 [Penicillium argentinense]KAJ5085352.1 hypothetical protein N7532_010123 [Penicillium argentinense]